MEYNEKVVNQLRSYCEHKLGSYEARPFGEYPICYKVMGKIFAQVNPQQEFLESH
jgi:predicted DNA-binding protein (MmcQ/YjbR family)